jgi:O-antigen/teichoic acid export membrane protein
MLVSAGLNIVLNFILTPLWGAVGASLATMISVITYNLSTLLYIRSKYGKSISIIL